MNALGGMTGATAGRTGLALRRAGGFAALYLAAAYLVAMPFFLLVVDYPNVTDPVAKVAMLAANHDAMNAIYLVTYVIFGLVLGVLAIALHERLRERAPAMAPVATGIGLAWAVVLVASGLIFNAGMASVVGVYATSPAQAVSAWQAIEPIAQGLGGAGGELLGGLWVLLVSAIVVRLGGLPKAIGWFGLAVGVAGVVSIVPPLREAAMLFGLLQIAWFIGLGIVMLRTADAPERLPAAGLQSVASHG